jgi:hypothetical protein
MVDKPIDSITSFPLMSILFGNLAVALHHFIPLPGDGLPFRKTLIPTYIMSVLD